MSGEHYIIDAFNLFHVGRSMPPCQAYFDIPNMVYALETYAANQGARVVVVFDGIRFEGTIPESSILTIMCSHPEQTGDEIIESFLATIPAAMRMQWFLVSNDRSLTDMVLGLGARHFSADSFAGKLRHANESKSNLHGDFKPKNKQKPLNKPFDHL